MPTTSPDNIPFPGPTDIAAPVEEWMEDQAVATQAAISRLRPRGVIRRNETANQSLANGGWVALTATGETFPFNTDPASNSGANYWIPATGLWRLDLQATFAANTGGNVRGIGFTIGGAVGSSDILFENNIRTMPAPAPSLSTGGVVLLTTGDLLHARATQNSGGSLQLLRYYWSAIYLGPAS